MSIRSKVLAMVTDISAAVMTGLMEASAVALAAQTPSQLAPRTAGPRLPDGMTEDELQAIAQQMGIDPNDVKDNVKVIRMPKKDGQEVRPTGPNDTLKIADGSLIKISDIPRDANGQPNQAWIDKNCACPDHTAKREAEELAAKKSAERGYSGGYV